MVLEIDWLLRCGWSLISWAPNLFTYTHKWSSYSYKLECTKNVWTHIQINGLLCIPIVLLSALKYESIGHSVRKLNGKKYKWLYSIWIASIGISIELATNLNVPITYWFFAVWALWSCTECRIIFNSNQFIHFQWEGGEGRNGALVFETFFNQ